MHYCLKKFQGIKMSPNSVVDSPAAFAEHYIVESIWNNHFPAGSFLPAERELSELIGVTRTTLREVLQRLSRDGWITIQHGKPTKVNDYWQTSGLNILDTLARLDESGSLDLVWHLLETRTSMFALYLRRAITKHPKEIIRCLEKADIVADEPDSYIKYDWEFFHLLSRATDNPISTLILNGFKTFYFRFGKFYYSKNETRRLALDFYHQLLMMVRNKVDIEKVISSLWQYSREGGKLYQSMRM